MRILVINYEYPPIGGGGGFVTRDILEQIVKLGHKVAVLTSAYKGLKKQENVNGVNIIRAPVMFRNKMEVASIPSMLSFPPLSVLKAVCNFKGRMYDIINTHFVIPSGPAGYVLSKIYRLPNVLSIHGGDIFDPSKFLSPHKTPLLSKTVSIMLNTADCVVAQSNDTKKNAYIYYNVKGKIDVIPLCIKKPIIKRKTRRDFGFHHDETIFCTIGRLISRKNIDDTLEVLSSLKKRYKFKFLIIGEGPKRYHLEGLIKSFSLEGIVRILGNVSDEEKFQLLDISDLYLSTSLHEGFGLVFLEAMECGLPIICYNRGGHNDFLTDGETGFLIELGDKKIFGEKVVELMTDIELRKNMSLHNNKIVENFYVNTCAERYISLFESVISQYSVV